MDIGKTVRCYTVEPLRDPVPHRRDTAEPTAPSSEPVDAWSQEALLFAEPALASLISPSLVRHLAG
jgi:hypothetical protein